MPLGIMMEEDATDHNLRKADAVHIAWHSFRVPIVVNQLKRDEPLWFAETISVEINLGQGLKYFTWLSNY